MTTSIGTKWFADLSREFAKPVVSAYGQRQAAKVAPSQSSHTSPVQVGGYSLDPRGASSFSEQHLDPDTGKLTERPVRQAVRHPVNVQSEPAEDPLSWAGRMVRDKRTWLLAGAGVAVFGAFRWMSSVTQPDVLRARSAQRHQLALVRAEAKAELPQRSKGKLEALARSSECRDLCLADGHKGSALKGCQAECSNEVKGAANG